MRNVNVTLNARHAQCSMSTARSMLNFNENATIDAQCHYNVTLNGRCQHHAKCSMSIKGHAQLLNANVSVSVNVNVTLDSK